MPEHYPFAVPFVRWAAYAPFPPGHIMPARLIYDHELLYVISGQGEIVLNGIAHAASRDRLFLVRPHEWHSFRALDEWQLLGVHFDWERLPDTLMFSVHRSATHHSLDEKTLFRQPREVAGWCLDSHPTLSLHKKPRVRRLLEEVVEAYADDESAARDENSRLAAGALFAAALIQIGCEARSLQQEALAPALGPDAARRFEQARRLLERPGHPLAVEAVAAQVGWGTDHLRRVCRTLAQTSPRRLQTAARIRNAKALLRARNLPVAEVAAACGFEDSSYFSRVFKAESGLTPRQFLAMAKK